MGRRLVRGLLLGILILLTGLAQPYAAMAGPVEWREGPPTAEGRQWWDAGSVRRTREGTLSVLSRFTPETDPEARPLGSLYVMQIDCDQKLYRDQQVNGLPRWGAQWEAAGQDALISSVIDAVCSADLA